jgi:hypothetical protein
MFIGFNNLPHCAPTERHVLCITESYKHLAPTEQSTNNQVQNTVCVLPGLCIWFLYLLRRSNMFIASKHYINMALRRSAM